MRPFSAMAMGAMGVHQDFTRAARPGSAPVVPFVRLTGTRVRQTPTLHGTHKAEIEERAIAPPLPSPHRPVGLRLGRGVHMPFTNVSKTG